MKLYYNFGDCEYEYEVDDTSEVLKIEFAKEFKIDRATAIDIIEEFELYDVLEDRYCDEIANYFEEEAYEQYKDDKEYSRDPLGYYGMSESDFH